eukprot:5284077-Pleurochrysis_carterae.AAC.6
MQTTGCTRATTPEDAHGTRVRARSAFACSDAHAFARRSTHTSTARSAAAHARVWSHEAVRTAHACGDTAESTLTRTRACSGSPVSARTRSHAAAVPKLHARKVSPPPLQRSARLFIVCDASMLELIGAMLRPQPNERPEAKARAQSRRDARTLSPALWPTLPRSPPLPVAQELHSLPWQARLASLMLVRVQRLLPTRWTSGEAS